MGAATKTRRRSIAAGLVLAFVAVLGSQPLLESQPAWAVEYPSWSDLEAARQNEASAQAAIAQITALLAQLEAAVVEARADEEAKGALWREADDKFQAAAQAALVLQGQADAAQAVATESGMRAGQMAAQLARGGENVTMTLFTSTGGDTDNLLYYMGMSAKVSEQASVIYDAALHDRNTAQALTDQAEIAKAELDLLEQAAAAAFEEAQVATVAAAAAVVEQDANKDRLEAQLVVLTERRAATEADYNAGVAARAAEAARLEAERIARIAASGGVISSGGWALPASGRITSSFGYRVSPTSGASSNHQGTDIGAWCGAPIYAAHPGTVIYAGRNGGYGNFILIDHGNSTYTAYAHIVDGGIYVSLGEGVSLAQHIAAVGTTGTSTGCHLHFEVRVRGVAVNSVPFMADRGIRIG